MTNGMHRPAKVQATTPGTEFNLAEQQHPGKTLGSSS